MYTILREYIKHFNDWYTFIGALIVIFGFIQGYFYLNNIDSKLKSKEEVYYAGPKGASVITKDGIFYAGEDGASYISREKMKK